jgi:hypothetical protein
MLGKHSTTELHPQAVSPSSLDKLWKYLTLPSIGQQTVTTSQLGSSS